MPSTKHVLPRERADRNRVLQLLRMRPDGLIFDPEGIDEWLAEQLDLAPLSVVELLRHMVSDSDICRLTARLRQKEKTNAASTTGIALPEAQEALDALDTKSRPRRASTISATIQPGGYRRLSP